MVELQLFLNKHLQYFFDICKIFLFSNLDDTHWVKGSKFAVVFALRSVFVDDKITSGEIFRSTELFEFTGDGTDGQYISGAVNSEQLRSELMVSSTDPVQWGFVDPFGDVFAKGTL